MSSKGKSISHEDIFSYLVLLYSFLAYSDKKCQLTMVVSRKNHWFTFFSGHRRIFFAKVYSEEPDMVISERELSLGYIKSSFRSQKELFSQDPCLRSVPVSNF